MNKVAFLALLTLVAGLAGCGAPTSTVSGTVTLDGSPMAGLIVAFTPLQGGAPAAATTDSSGKYTVVTAPGKYKVAITTEKTVDEGTSSVDEDNAPYDPNGGSSGDAYAEANEASAKGGTAEYRNASNEEKIPAKYNKNSELTAEFAAGEVTQDFTLDTK